MAAIYEFFGPGKSQKGDNINTESSDDGESVKNGNLFFQCNYCNHWVGASYEVNSNLHKHIKKTLRHESVREKLAARLAEATPKSSKTSKSARSSPSVISGIPPTSKRQFFGSLASRNQTLITLSGSVSKSPKYLKTSVIQQSRYVYLDKYLTVGFYY